MRGASAGAAVELDVRLPDLHGKSEAAASSWELHHVILFCGMLPWLLFQRNRAALGGPQLVDNADLITKHRVPGRSRPGFYFPCPSFDSPPDRLGLVVVASLVGLRSVSPSDLAV